MFSLLASLALFAPDSTSASKTPAPIIAGLQAGPMILGSSDNSAHHLGNTGYAMDFALRSGIGSVFEIEFKGTSGSIVRDNGALNAVQSEVRAGSVLFNWIPTVSLRKWGEDPVGIDRLDSRTQRTELKPFIGIGIGHSDLHRSVDRLDVNGLRYHLWNDGTLRSFSENSEQSAHAVILERDFNYETDFDQANSSRSAITVPMQAGIQLELGGPLRARMGASGWIGSDGFGNAETMLQGFFGLDYSIGAGLARAVSTRRSHASVSGESAEWDLDRDGICDLVDRCPGTPYDIGVKVEVDLYGCPVDTDGDGYADYRDAAPLSAAVWRNVDEPVVEVDTVWTSSTVSGERMTKVSSNSNLTPAELNALMKFRRLVTHNNSIFAVADNSVADGEMLYRVQVGAFSTTRAEDLKTVFEGWEVLALHGDDGMTRYVSRAFPGRAEAEAHRDALASAGFVGVFIASYGSSE
jgi:hypothetical protein